MFQITLVDKFSLKGNQTCFFSVLKKALNGNESLFNLQFQGMASGKSLGKLWWGRTRMVSNLSLFFAASSTVQLVYTTSTREKD